MVTSENHDETHCLGGFLRSRRERLSPTDAGIPDGPRRRTPGLRREEVAALAGISVDYLIRLEQGRETRPSGDVLRSLARALQLTPDEDTHLRRLAEMAAEPERSRRRSRTTALDDSTVRLLDRMAGTPAYIGDGLTDILTWNNSFQALMGATGLLEMTPPNLLRYTFLHPEAQVLYKDWRAVAQNKISHLQAAIGDPRLSSLVGELAVESAEFAQFWTEHQVEFKRTGTVTFDHPLAGEMHMDFSTLMLPSPSSLHLVAYLPSDAASQAALDHLERDQDWPEPVPATDGQRPQLRIVNG